MASRANEVPCPDPSAHEHHSKLADQASTAALYVTDPTRYPDPPRSGKQDVLGPDGKLSSASAATSLKYAKPQDLPSFPSRGFEGNSANKAAMLAKDYKMKDLWEPELSSGASKAALLAHRKGGDLDLWQPTASKNGHTAATLAMQKKGLSPQLDRGYTPDGKSKALRAATLSVNRGRSGSMPSQTASPYPDSQNSAANALKAATASHRAGTVKGAPDGWNSEANQAARIQHAHIDPKFLGENPNIDIDPEDTKHQAALHASAVSMAKQMYQVQNRTVLGSDPAGSAATLASSRQQASHQADVKQQALQYINLQDTAHKLAQERLAKIDKGMEDSRYREHYGYPDQQPSQRKRFSVRGRGRRRANSEGEEPDSSDEERATRIRHQMTKLNTGVNSVDEKKRTDDRAMLLAAAERKVHAQMHTMDEKVFADTGKVPPAMLEEWEEKARKRAQENQELAAKPENKGKTNIGGGKFMDTSEIEAIAAARLAPTLAEINETAEKRRAHDEELRQEKAAQEKHKADEKLKHREEKDEQKRTKNKEKESAKAREAAEHPHDDEKKHGGLLGRFSKLRRSKKEAQTEKAVVEPKHAEEPKHESEVPAPAAAVVAPVEVIDHADDEESRDGVSDLEDNDEPVRSQVPGMWVDYAPVTTTTARPAAARMHTGDYTNEIPSSAYSKPDLERHLSHIQDSDDDDLSDDDDDAFEDSFDGPDEPTREEDHIVSPLASTDEHHYGRDAALVGGGAGALGVAGYDATSDKQAGSAPHTLGPHKTDIANVLDPRVNPDRYKTDEAMFDPAPTTVVAPQNDTATVMDPTSVPDTSVLSHQQNIDPSDPVVDAEKSDKGKGVAAAAPVTATAAEKGSGGFFSRFRKRQSKPDVASIPATHPSTTTPVDSASAGRSTDPAVSSGDAGEEETGRGRRSYDHPVRAYLQAEFGLGSLSHGINPKVKTGEDDGDDHFEEARDHFDETLAPPAAFAGQKKSESPARETRFREEV